VKDEDIDLRSVNWEHGMFVTPEHFLRQERYIDSLGMWVLRNCTDVYGLIGGGPRVDAAERGAAKHDPIVDIYEDDDSLRVTVSQCRGLSPAGDIIEIDPAHAINISVPKTQLESARELGIYVTSRPHEKSVEDDFDDQANPQMRSSRRRTFEVKLDVAAEAAGHSVLLARLSRSEHGLHFERSSQFIPPCATVSAHSELIRAWREITEKVSMLADRYAELHRAIGEYMNLAVEREIGTREDAETLSFVGRMVAALEDCAYQILDPIQPPYRFFQQMYRLIRSAAIYLDLSPPTVSYFQMLGEAGETEFIPLLEQERQMLEMARQSVMHPDLGLDVQRVSVGLQGLQRLEQALEGKYIDFRVSPSLESLNFVFDRGGEAFYQSVSRPSRPQVFNQELTFVFARLKLEGREAYRLILMGEPEARFEIGESLSAEIRINPGGGQPSKPIYKKVACDIFNQRNFAIDFDAPSDVVTIADLRVIVKVTRPMRSGLLYVRRRFYGKGQSRPQSDYARSAPAPVIAPEPDPVVGDYGRRVQPPADEHPQRSVQTSTNIKRSRLSD
jgi:hypothetical protein